jgi:hypothetical protein
VFIRAALLFLLSFSTAMAFGQMHTPGGPVGTDGTLGPDTWKPEINTVTLLPPEDKMTVEVTAPTG